jgi:adenylate kinase
MKYRTILLFGAPGAGKGTQGRILGQVPSYFYCACGDVFRNLRAQSPLAKVFLEYSSRGELVPDEATVDLWRDFISRSIASGKFNPEEDTLLLDGIPRNVRQAEMLSDTLDVIAMFSLECKDFERLVERLQRRALHENRLDDANVETIRNRLKVYKKETAPVLKFYGKNLIHRIDGTQAPVKVLRDLLKVIDRLKL